MIIRVACLLVVTASAHAFVSIYPVGHMPRLVKVPPALLSVRMSQHQQTETQGNVNWIERRAVLEKALGVGACGCALCFSPSPASALAQLVEPPADAVKRFDLPRDNFLDGN
jgi:hypothetical protein